MGKYEVVSVKNGGLEMDVCNFGGAIMRLMVPDSKGRMGDVVLGYDKPERYSKGKYYFGAIVGRFANRIGGAKAVIDGKKYCFDSNDGKNSLHGGNKGFDKVFWDISKCSGEGWKGVFLHYHSPDMEGGYPGNLDVGVYYKLTDNAELSIEYSAVADKPTVCNLTNHTYFNLSAGKQKDILDHHIKINAAYYTPVDANLIPTGEVLSVAGTALDMRKFGKIRSGVESGSKLIADAFGGFDHNFVLPNSGGGIVCAASVYEPISGRCMEVLTSEPGMQFYTGNFIKSEKGKWKYDKHAGFCLETQVWPDAPNKPHFPSAELLPGQVYASATVYRFSSMREA